MSWVNSVDEKAVHSGERVHKARSMNIGSEEQALVWSERFLTRKRGCKPIPKEEAEEAETVVAR